MSNFNRKEKGQGLVEYALILVLIAIVVIVAMTTMGSEVSDTFDDVNSELAGGEVATAVPPTATDIPATATPIPTWQYCAQENGYCSFSGTKEVRYGANGTWTTQTFTNGVSCSNGVFGDPTPGIVKSCEVLQ